MAAVAVAAMEAMEVVTRPYNKVVAVVVVIGVMEG